MKTTKRLLSILLSLIIAVAGLAALGVPANAAYNVGDTICFGTYPQTKVAETSALKAAANAAAWKSYGYYSGNGTDYGIIDGQMKPGDWMKFADFFCDGVKYRAVKITKTRPGYTTMGFGIEFFEYQKKTGIGRATPIISNTSPSSGVCLIRTQATLFVKAALTHSRFRM